MSELNKCLKILYENYAVVFPPIDPKVAQQASVKLVKSGVPPIPLDYVSFLAATNGLSWNGTELFSLSKIERNKGAFYHPGILDNFQFCQNNALMKKKLLLGAGWELLLVYDFVKKEYQQLDRYTYAVVRSFPSFLAFLQYTVASIQKHMPTSVAP